MKEYLLVMDLPDSGRWAHRFGEGVIREIRKDIGAGFEQVSRSLLHGHTVRSEVVCPAFWRWYVSFSLDLSRLIGGPSEPPNARDYGRPGAGVPLALDLTRPELSVLARALAPQFGLDEGIVLLCALAVFIGHLFPVFFRFQGGKGVATALGVLIGIDGTLAALVLPEIVPASAWQGLLHNQAAWLIKAALLYRRRSHGFQRVIIDVAYHLKK